MSKDDKNTYLTINKDYYVIRKKKIIKDAVSILKGSKEILLKEMNLEDYDELVKKTKINLENMLANLPYVGGKKSPFTDLMLQSVLTAAFYKAYKELNIQNQNFGEVLYEISEFQAELVPKYKKWLARRMVFTKKYMNSWKYWMNISQKGLFPGNWVGEYVEGNSENFEFGLNFRECGLIKLFKKEHIEEVAPYVCLSDYARMRALGVGFKRTKNLASGGDFCDFRFLKNHTTARGWPPENTGEQIQLPPLY